MTNGCVSLLLHALEKAFKESKWLEIKYMESGG